MTYSPRASEWERLPWLADAPIRIARRVEPKLPVGWLATLMIAVAAGSFWAGTTSIRAAQQQRQVVRTESSDTDDQRAIMAAELSDARAFGRRAARANAPY